MRLGGLRGSGNIEDRRLSSGLGWKIGGGGLLGAILLMFIFNINPLQLIGLLQLNRVIEHQADYTPTAYDDSLVHFSSVVLASTEDVWTDVFASEGLKYEAPTLLVYHNFIESACGMAGKAMGPFYCPEDRKIYLDVAFSVELRDHYKAGGDFAFAYVIAHEVGHHVQQLLGTLSKENQLRAKADETTSNALSVRIELQADFYAGVWARHAKEMFDLTREDILEALAAAAAVGDDRIQQEAQGYVVPDSFTHGTSEQRQRWFMLGYDTGDMGKGDTFNAERL